MRHRIRLRGFAAALFALLAAVPASALTLTEMAAWPGGEVPVCWQDPRPEHRQERRLVRKAIAATWERESAVRFTGWRTCREGMKGVWIAFENGYPRTAERGVRLDGRRSGVVLPALWSLAALSINLKAPVHEFGHVLGFGHEYARPDMPEHLVARCAGSDASGVRYIEDDRALTPFDRTSIMVGCRAPATRAFSQGLAEISPTDIMGLVRTYGSHPSNVLDPDESGDLFGASITLGDLDGDGRPDLAVAAPGENAGEGAVYLFRGTRRRGLRPWRVASRADRRQFLALPGLVRARPLDPGAIAGVVSPGFPEIRADGAVMLEADLDGDGHADRVIGLPAADGGAPGSGAVVVLRGLSGGGHTAWYWFGQRH